SRTHHLILGIFLTFLVALPIWAQEPATESDATRGIIEFGPRGLWGDVYGRPDLPFKPDLSTSKLNEYSDIRSNFYLRRARLSFDDIFGSHNYVTYQTDKTLL